MARPDEGACHGLSLLTTALLLILSACSAVGVIESSDPRVKLDQARELFERQGRFTVAKRLISEALDIYQQRGDELGVAEAYRTFGFFYRADVTHFGRPVLVPDDFTTPGRYDLSQEYFKKALAIFEKHQRWDMASNVYFSMGQTYKLAFNDDAHACEMMNSALAASRRWKAEHPTADIVVQEGFSSFEDLIRQAKIPIGCT